MASSRTPLRENGLIVKEEYKFLLRKSLPDIEVEVTSSAGTRRARLYDLVGQDGFIIAFQPGASTKAEVETKMCSQKPGASGCTSEVIALDKAAKDLEKVNYKKLLIVSTKSSEQQKQIFIDRADDLPNKSVEFISDPKGEFARALQLFMTNDTLYDAVNNQEKEIEFIERVLVSGNRRQVEYLRCPSMGLPADNVNSLVALVTTRRQQQMGVYSSSSSPTQFKIPKPNVSATELKQDSTQQCKM